MGGGVCNWDLIIKGLGVCAPIKQLPWRLNRPNSPRLNGKYSRAFYFFKRGRKCFTVDHPKTGLWRFNQYRSRQWRASIRSVGEKPKESRGVTSRPNNQLNQLDRGIIITNILGLFYLANNQYSAPTGQIFAEAVCPVGKIFFGQCLHWPPMEGIDFDDDK